jgi:single-strand DNA-binding protein
VNSITVVGNLTRDPELRYTNAQKPMCTFTVAYSTRRKDGDQWVDGDTAYFDCVTFGTLAENVAETLSKGTRAIVAGKLQQRSWDTPDGDKRTKVEIIVDACGRDLRWADSPAPSRPASRPASRPDELEEPF